MQFSTGSPSVLFDLRWCVTLVCRDSAAVISSVRLERGVKSEIRMRVLTANQLQTSSAARNCQRLHALSQASHWFREKDGVRGGFARLHTICMVTVTTGNLFLCEINEVGSFP